VNNKDVSEFMGIVGGKYSKQYNNHNSDDNEFQNIRGG